MSIAPSARAVAQPLVAAGRRVAPWIATLARVGYAASALVYATIGTLAARAALGHGGKTTDAHGALREVVEAPFGAALLVVCAIGFAGFALWRLVAAVTDAEGHGRDMKGIAARVGAALGGLARGGLALAAYHLATGDGDGGGSNPHSLTARALDLPGGRWLVGAVALALIGYGGYKVYCGWAAKLDRRLPLADLPADARRWVVPVSRLGIAARGVVAGMIGVLVGQAVMRQDPGEAGGVRESLEMIGRTGRWPLGVVAVGLVAYAVYQLVRARYRRLG
jgi:hypothetical protein